MSTLKSAETENHITIIGPSATQMVRDPRRREIVENSIDISVLNEKYIIFLESLAKVVNSDTPEIKGFELDEIKFSAEISANGDFKLMGTGLGVEATGGVTFSLKRKGRK